MVNNNSAQLDAVFSALSDPTRRAMLHRLSANTLSVAELGESFGITKSAITKHVKVLEKAGLLNRSVSGRVHHCSLNSRSLQSASKWIKFYERFWNNKLDSLETYLNQSKND